MSVTCTYYMDVFTCYLDVLPRYVTCMCVIRISVTWTDLPACVTLICYLYECYPHVCYLDGFTCTYYMDVFTYTCYLDVCYPYARYLYMICYM